VLIAHNVCSLNKILALTAALHKLHQENQLPRHLILWHHDLAWTTPRYLPEMAEGYPMEFTPKQIGAKPPMSSFQLRREELADLMLA
ncbi:MAG: hypothetical protein IPG80_04995, partial [Anaerolineales bacterium]|uniref:hypothetical protein n=1 Tax=Candidatus Villigracilis vicinus TaxID=3140679 RepID=UPI00313567F5|nr:hypothetical protein [Anaerolineales bacterium]